LSYQVGGSKIRVCRYIRQGCESIGGNKPQSHTEAFVQGRLGKQCRARRPPREETHEAKYFAVSKERNINYQRGFRISQRELGQLAVKPSQGVDHPVYWKAPQAEQVEGEIGEESERGLKSLLPCDLCHHVKMEVWPSTAACGQIRSISRAGSVQSADSISLVDPHYGCSAVEKKAKHLRSMFIMAERQEN